MKRHIVSLNQYDCSTLLRLLTTEELTLNATIKREGLTRYLTEQRDHLTKLQNKISRAHIILLTT